MSISSLMILTGILLMPLSLAACSQKPARPPLRRTPDGLTLTHSSPEHLPPFQIATFAAGCFWGVEQVFREEPGVLATAVGFTGGHVAHPSYRQVCTGTTGHAEAVRIAFDPSRTSYRRLLELFLEIHDPTTPNRQGPDIGEQYRSAVFCENEAQEREAREALARLSRSGELSAPPVTQVEKAGPFYLAEEYHQQYVEKGGFAVCHRRKTH